ncbi:uncharacterized protein [Rutidosis leptorrhynchoides]|uniref:uncharacterized protein n=1 Tax=Rutidosis leptorrhynchoides TaxID=125765 RepID=UPI003A9938E5
MKIISLNIHGFGSGKESKFGDVKSLCVVERPSILALQETKCHNLVDNWIFRLWGSNDCGYVQKEMVGKSGGQLLIWDKNIFEVSSELIGDFFIAIRGKWKQSGNESIIVNVYGPHDDANKCKFWDSLNKILCIDGVSWVICGDFNEVRDKSERLNCEFFDNWAKRFNEFINRNSLVDIPLGGRKFTRVSDDGLKMSKLDRFLVSDDFLSFWNDLKVVALDRSVSDHCPILMSDGEVDFGPKPFKIYDDWFGVEGIDKRKYNKNNIRGINVNGSWCENPNTIKEVAFNHFKSIFEVHNSDGPSLEELFSESITSADNELLEAPFTEEEIWESIKCCVSSKAPGPDGFNFGFFKKFWSIIKDDLVGAINWFWVFGEFSKGCNASFVSLIPKKSDPPSFSDYRPISLICSYYKIIAKMLSLRICRVMPRLVGMEQSAFLGGRYILDGALVANEVVEDLKRKKKHGLIFKVDFEKAFD